VVDKEAVVDGNLVTSRNPDDIPAFTDAFIKLVEKADAAVEPA
jgi:protease I